MHFTVVYGGGDNDLLRQQNAEKMALERELLQDEEKALSTKLSQTQTERQALQDDLSANLADKLQGNYSSAVTWSGTTPRRDAHSQAPLFVPSFMSLSSVAPTDMILCISNQCAV